MGRLDKFEEFRRKMNEKILSADHLGIKRFFALDSAVMTASVITAFSVTPRVSHVRNSSKSSTCL